MISRCIWLLAFLFLCFGAGRAGAQNTPVENAPDISLRSDTELGAFKAGALSNSLVLEELRVAVDVHAGLAQVSLWATLRNETGEDVEASFTYPLPEGAVINGYALDIAGDLVDGVLMPKERAEALYTDRVTQSIDPGIAARTADNRYRTRIYPIAADGGRRSIRLDFAAPVPTSGLRLPLTQAQITERVQIEISGDGAEMARSPIEGAAAENVTLSGDIYIPAASSAGSLTTHAGQTFLTLPLDTQKSASAVEINSVAIIWDTSLSRDANTLITEQRFISDVLARLTPKAQSLIHGADRIDFAAPYASASDLNAAIKRLTYDGATDLAKLLNAESLTASDICIVITDGKSTLGAGIVPNLPCRAFTFSAQENPNADWLAIFAAKNGGANLSDLGASEAARRISNGGGPQLPFGQTGEIFKAGQRQWLILPVEKTSKTIDVVFTSETKTIKLRDLETRDHAAAGSMWAQRRLAELRTRGPQAFDALVKTSRRWNVQTQETAFLVLEEVSDYLDAKIDPPRSFPAEQMVNYKEALAEIRAEEAEARAEHFDDLRELWDEQVAWWNGDWAKLSPPQVAVEYSVAPVEGEVVQSPPPPSIVRPAEGQLDVELDVIVTTGSRVSDEEIIVTGSRRINPAGSLPAEISVTSRPWSPDRPYLTALANLDGAAFETAYRQQRRDYGDRPSFYLEIADQLHRKGQSDRAARMAATALELDNATLITRTNVADRLLMFGRTPDAIALYRDVLPASQDRPQPFYNLALALIQAGDKATGPERDALYGEAFEHLVHVINSPWEDDCEGIHLIALQDLNRTLARLPKRKRQKFEKALGLDKAYYQNLPVDIRVLIDWTADDADLDIHVIERVGAEDEEEAYYSNPATERGGRVSNDMTEGYGPEEYMIRRAPDGLYRVESDYYAQDDYAEDGALKLRARLWRNFGRKTESFETVIIEMLEEKEDAYVLGEIQVGPKAAPAIAAEPESE